MVLLEPEPDINPAPLPDELVPLLELVPDELLGPDDTAIPLEAVDDAVGFRPVVDVELRETKTPPATRDGEVLLLVLVAASLYALSVFGDGVAGSFTTIAIPF